MNQVEIQFSLDAWLADHQIFRFAHAAMATIFEIFIAGKDKTYAAQAAQAAFGTLDRLEQELSRFVENSDIYRINQLQKKQSTIIGPDTFECLQACQEIFDETGGAFDISAGFLIKLWKEKDLIGKSEFEALFKNEISKMGLEKLELNEQNLSVTLLADKVELDLGGFGKGYALDQMAGILREWSIESALLHGGRSSVLALEAPAGQRGWPLSISDPENPDKIMDKQFLRYRALSGSGLKKGSHIVNPYTGYPVKERLAAWAGSESAALSDALSTAFMIMEISEIKYYLSKHRTVSGLIITGGQNNDERKIIRWDRKR